MSTFYGLRAGSYIRRITLSRLRFCSVTYLKVSSFTAFHTLLVLLVSLNPYQTILFVISTETNEVSEAEKSQPQCCAPHHLSRCLWQLITATGAAIIALSLIARAFRVVARARPHTISCARVYTIYINFSLRRQNFCKNTVFD